MYRQAEYFSAVAERYRSTYRENRRISNSRLLPSVSRFRFFHSGPRTLLFGRGHGRFSITSTHHCETRTKGDKNEWQLFANRRRGERGRREVAGGKGPGWIRWS